jgi:hypothetical protein
VWSTSTVVDDEGHTGSCQWTWSGQGPKGRELGLDWRTRVVVWLAIVVDTWNTHRGEDVVEWAVLPARSRTGWTHDHNMGDAHTVHYSRGFGSWTSKNHPVLQTTGFRPSLASKLGSDSSCGNRRQHVVSSWRVRWGEATSCGTCGCQIKILGVGPFRPRLSGYALCI